MSDNIGRERRDGEASVWSENLGGDVSSSSNALPEVERDDDAASLPHQPDPFPGPDVLSEPPRVVAAALYRSEHASAPIEAMWREAAPEPALPRPRGKVRRRAGENAVPRRRDEPSLKSLLMMWPGLLVLALSATFFAWVSAEPFWLSVGHGTHGTVVVGDCAAEGFAPRCEGAFIPEGERDLSSTVRITGDTDAERPGTTLQAQAVSSTSRTVYIGDAEGLFLRWGLGLVALAGCGLAIAGVTGAWRWRGRARRVAVLVSMACPFVMFVGALAFTW